ncbi:hypothetical protein FACS189487_06540 [Campylobacterota bacterium]|nr:hypothetical protein FACS189487_06540 [Campylobacterota bacterium]
MNVLKRIWVQKNFKIFFVTLIVCIAIHFTFELCTPYLLQYYFYKTNGDRVDLPYYYIDVPFPEWSIIENDDGYYRVMSINNKYFDILPLTETDKSFVYEMIKIEEDFSTVTRKVYSGVEGTKYLSFLDCNGTQSVFFVSDDRQFFIWKFPYDPTEENEKNLDILLNGVRKK